MPGLYYYGQSYHYIGLQPQVSFYLEKQPPVYRQCRISNLIYSHYQGAERRNRCIFDAQRMGRQIARLRKENRFTQEQLAEILNISPQAVSKWENAKAVPEVSTIYELSRLFNCSVDRVLDPSSSVSRNMDFDYEFLIKPRVPVADYSGPEWPKSISSAALLTALKLFFGLELRRDGKKLSDQ